MVRDLKKSMDFFSALGFTFNPQFTDENATCMVVSEQAYVMLLVNDFFRSFHAKQLTDTTAHTEVLLAVSAESRQEVDDLVDKAAELGASSSDWKEDQDFMYGRSFEDLDGHIWEVVYMDPSAIEQQ
jgi:predicted lactoylglutathione lyase